MRTATGSRIRRGFFIVPGTQGFVNAARPMAHRPISVSIIHRFLATLRALCYLLEFLGP
jgi:hypothetical protein